MSKLRIANGEFYHLYNRGVDKRDVFLDEEDFDRFLKSIATFNTTQPAGGIYAQSFVKVARNTKARPLVNLIAYCINPNHFHMILEQCIDRGVSEFMRRLGGYTKYFNNKYKRSGVLFQGRCKIIHIESDEYLLHLSSYINLNAKVHRLRHRMSKSSWEEYVRDIKGGLCKNAIILDQFKSKAEYREFAENSLEDILERKERTRGLTNLFLE